MYKDHEDYTSPRDDAILWRYLDFTKFVSLLERSALFFARADKFDDPFEGSYSRMNRELRPKLYAGKKSEDSLQGWVHFTKEVRRYTLISCWHESIHESAAMWRLYSRETDGIAIKSGFKSFKTSFTTREDVFIGKVNYVDYERDFIPESNILFPFLHKRKSFEHEREVRAIVLTIPTKEGKVDTSQEMFDNGKYYGVDLSLLIQDVIVAPYAPEWFLELITSVVARYNLDVPVARSSLADNPTWE